MRRLKSVGLTWTPYSYIIHSGGIHRVTTTKKCPNLVSLHLENPLYSPLRFIRILIVSGLGDGRVGVLLRTERHRATLKSLV